MNSINALKQMEQTIGFQISEVKKGLQNKKCPTIWNDVRNGKRILYDVKKLAGRKYKRVTIDTTSQQGRQLIYDYIQHKRLAKLERNQKKIRRTIKELEDDGLPETLREVARKYEVLSRQYLRELTYDKSVENNQILLLLEDIDDERFNKNKKNPVIDGITVRSKSEGLIIKSLVENNVIFRYEQHIEINGEHLLPDFLIIKDNGKILIWEHIGLVNDPYYLDRQATKLRTYLNAGFVPWDNLIITFDTKDGVIDMNEVDFKIQQKILT